MVQLGGTGLSYAASALASLSVSSVLYGILSLMFIISTTILWNKHVKSPSDRHINIPVMAVSTVMFMLASAQLGVNFYRAWEAFILDPKGAMDYLINSGTDTPSYILNSTFTNTQILLGDAFILYRLYVVWAQNLLVTIPFVFCYFGSIATAIGQIVTTTIRNPSVSIFSDSLRDWPLCFLALTLAHNLGCSTLISFRIWSVHRFSVEAGVGSHGLVPLAILIVESGLLYSATALVAFVLFFASSGAHKIVLDAIVQIVGITFCGIIVSVSLGMTKSQTTQSGTRSILVFPDRSGIGADVSTAGEARSRLQSSGVEKRI